MNSQELLASLRTLFQKYRKTVWFRVTYLVLLGVLVAQLYLLTASALACVVILLMPISVFVVPYWIGERKMRNFAANALVVFSIAILVGAAMSTQALLSQDQAIPLESLPGFAPDRTMRLSNGNVSPYRGSPPGPFTFRVNLTTVANDTPGNFSVFLNLTIVTGLSGFERPSYSMAYSPGSGSSSNTINGSWFETRLNLTDSIYGYGFSARNATGNWTSAGPDFGPLTASGWTYFGFFVYFTALSGVMVIAFLFYFAILFLWWYTARARAARGPRKTGATEIPKARPTATGDSVAKAAKAAAFTCTNCGADVGEADDKCPKCGAAFED